MNKLKITNCGEEVKKIIEDFIYKETDIGELIEDFSQQYLLDYIIYGYHPFDYLGEIKLCMKKQKLQ